MKIAFAGFCHSHIFALYEMAKNHADYEIVDACEESEEYRALAKEKGVNFTYESYDKMLEEADLDVVIVETGADIHAEFCCKALEKNINVLSDIPNVASLEEAEMLWDAAKKSKAIISTGANPNYQKFTYLLKEFYDKGLLGDPYCMEAEYIHWTLPNSAMRIHLNENGDWRKLLVPIRYCTHSLGPLLTILNEELRYVSCFGTGIHGETDLEENKKNFSRKP